VPPRRRYCWLLALALLVAVPFQGTRGLYETSEGRYAEVAREMLETGNYLEPTLGYRPHWTKPPPTYWAIAAGLAVADRSLWGVRAYNVVAFAATALAVAAIGGALWGEAAGWIAGLVYLSSLYPAIGCASATADTLLALWVVLGELAYVRAWRAGGSRAWVRVFWVMFGVAFFTKGPPALLPLLAGIAFHAASRRPFRLADPVGLALFAAAGSWWYALEIARHPELFAYFFGHELIARSLSSEFHRNAQWYGPFAVYAPVLLVAPGLWLLDAFRIARRERLFAPRRWVGIVRRGGSAGAFLLCWFGLPLLLFALSKSRLPLYLLPLYPAVALAIARGLAPSGAAPPWARIHATAGAAIAVLIAIKAVAAFVPSKRDATRVYREAVAAAGPDARLALYEEPEFYGFEFHAGRELVRMSATGAEPWADQSFTGALASADPARSLGIVARGGWGADLEAKLRERAVPFQRVPLAGRALFVIDGSR
jgi:4-amino-4-deoxy-L-arabinose transferase